MNTILRKQFLAHVGQTSPSPMLVEVARAEGSFFYTPDGKRYYDLVAGVSVSNVGHCNPDVVRAVQEQAARYMHVMVYGEMVESPQVTYAARIAAALPAPLDSVYFVNSGAEAVEGALKLAKRVTERTELVSMRRAYHGSTHGAMSMMGTPEGEEWKAAFRPLLPDVRAIEFNDFEALDRITRRTAAVLVEPVQGEAGVRLPAAGWLEALRERCDRTGALLVFDEIQTGLGRTGALFAMQRYGVTPDIVCLAKAFGGGMPVPRAGAGVGGRDGVVPEAVKIVIAFPHELRAGIFLQNSVLVQCFAPRCQHFVPSFFLSASTGGRISSSTMAAARKMDGVGTVFTTPRST